jgi:L-threonylcarbamoyladenylate synthase
LLRQGAVSLAQLRAVIPEIMRASALSAEVAKSPGLRHRHYSPRARIRIVDGRTRISNSLYTGGKFGYIGLRAPAEQFSAVKICPSLEDYARSLFEFFRECDRQGIEEIYCEAVSQEGIGAALMDRLVRAADDGR